MPTSIDHSAELVRSLNRLGVGLIELVTSVGDEIVVLDRERHVVAVVGDVLDERRSDKVLGRTLREFVGRPASAVHEAAHARALHNQSSVYEWTKGKAREMWRLSTSAFPLRNSRATIVGVVMITRKTASGRDELDGADSPLRHLSPRERQVLDLLGQGYRPRSIAETLHVSPDTVRNHLKAMFKKTGTHSQEEITALLRASIAL